jgi:hypothetical protein
MSEAEEKFGVDPETGFASELWNSWETNWSGTTSQAENTVLHQQVTVLLDVVDGLMVVVVDLLHG